MAEAAWTRIDAIIGIARHDRPTDRRNRPRQWRKIGLGGSIGLGLRDGPWQRRRRRRRRGRGCCPADRDCGCPIRFGFRRHGWRCSDRRRDGFIHNRGWCGRRLFGPRDIGTMLKPAVPAFGAPYRPAIDADGAVRDRIAGVARGARNNHGVSNHAGRIAARGLRLAQGQVGPFSTGVCALW